MKMTSRTTGIAGAVIGLVQAVILLVNAFGWVTITGEQSAAITAVVTAVVTVVASRKVNDQIGVALHTEVPVDDAGTASA
jgi:uncharacterized membrane protein